MKLPFIVLEFLACLFEENVEEFFSLLWALFLLALMGVAAAGWVTHVYVCLKTEQWLLLIGGAIAVPVGVIHGVGIWFGQW
ncbi:MAG: hypothetical protein JKY96_01475 [Phycisphaerales bacterium]|nr:hypothetical protein [Phycisphaerales bacterium]